MIIRRADEGDIDAIAAMEILCFSDPWSRESVAAEFSGLNPTRYYAAEEEGTLIGYAGVWEICPEGYITNVAVHPGHRRKGVASALLAQLLADEETAGITDVTLEVRVSNEAAIALYSSFGFETKGLRKKYYSDGEDALIMWREAGAVTSDGAGASAPETEQA